MLLTQTQQQQKKHLPKSEQNKINEITIRYIVVMWAE